MLAGVRCLAAGLQPKSDRVTSSLSAAPSAGRQGAAEPARVCVVVGIDADDMALWEVQQQVGCGVQQCGGCST